MTNPLGSFIWYDVMTSDMQAAERFYGKVVGWEPQQFPGETPYTVLNLPGSQTGVGGIMPSPEGAPKMWNGYIYVDDVDDYAQRVTEAGGAIHRQPWDIPGVGRMAVAADPQGAMFMLYKPTPPEGGAPPMPEDEAIGTIGWRELMTTDWQGAFDFYSKLFGWSVDHDFDMGEMGLYQLFNVDGEPTGGMMDKPAQMPAPAWQFYFNVPAIDAAAGRVTGHGGKLLMGPMQVPGGQWIVQCQDPQGARFALVAPER